LMQASLCDHFAVAQKATLCASTPSLPVQSIHGTGVPIMQVLPCCSLRIIRYRTPREPYIGRVPHRCGTELVPARSRGGPTHVPVGSGSSQVYEALTPWCVRANCSFAGTPMSDTQSTVCSSLGGLLVNSAMTIETSMLGDILHPSFVVTLIRRDAHSNIDLPDLEPMDAWRQMCLQEINDNLKNLGEDLYKTNAAKKLTSKLQSEHFKCACLLGSNKLSKAMLEQQLVMHCSMKNRRGKRNCRGRSVLFQVWGTARRLLWPNPRCP